MKRRLPRVSLATEATPTLRWLRAIRPRNFTATGFRFETRSLLELPRRRPRGVSSVQYLKFPMQGRAPVALGADLPGLEVETALNDEQRAALP